MDEILKLIPDFAKLANKKSGLCQYDSFIENLGFESEQYASILFNMFDQVFSFILKNQSCLKVENKSLLLFP